MWDQGQQEIGSLFSYRLCVLVALLLSGHAGFSGWLLEILMDSSCRGNVILYVEHDE